MPVSVAIVEDDTTIREGLTMLLNSSRGFRCLGAYRTAEEAISPLRQQPPNVILMDIHLPGMSGIDCVRNLKDGNTPAHIIMLTVYENDESIFQALAAGATGYLVKRTKPEKLLEAIQEVINGGAPMSAEIARKVVTVFQQFRVASSDVTEQLSKREMEILGYLTNGFRYKEIAEKLFISIETVRTHVHKIYEKLHVRSRAEAMMKVMQK
ncbi:MAG: response regulator transcription factor [Bacteroidota bacterium]